MKDKELVIQWITENYGCDQEHAKGMLDDFFFELPQCTVLVDPNGKSHTLYKNEGDETLTEY